MNLNSFIKSLMDQNVITNKYNLSSRIHKLIQKPIYVKRDDELLHGTKIRKYSSLLPFLQKNGHKKVILLGSKYSNNIYSLSRILIENQIEPILYLNGVKENQLYGNHLLTNLFVKKQNINYVKKSEYSNLIINHPYFIVEEGSSIPQSSYGLLTLTNDILQNEADNNVKFNHIFIDSGSGMTSSSLIFGFSLLKRFENFKIHIVQIGDINYEEILEKYKLYIDETKTIHQYVDFQVYPFSKFGKIKENVFSFIKEFAQVEGILLDPVYTPNLFLKSFEIINSQNLKGNCLIIHSGGLSSLSGFQRQLEKSINQ